MSIFRKIGRILLLVGGILELLSMALCFLLAIGAFVFGGLVATNTIPDIGLEPQMGLIIGIASGLVLLIAAVICLVAGVIGIKGFKAHTKGTYIANIVFGVLVGWSLFLIAGAVLGLIALKKETPAEEPAAEAPVQEEVK